MCRRRVAFSLGRWGEICRSKRHGDRHRGYCKAEEGWGSQAEYVGSWASLVLTIRNNFISMAYQIEFTVICQAISQHFY